MEASWRLSGGLERRAACLRLVQLHVIDKEPLDKKALAIAISACKGQRAPPNLSIYVRRGMTATAAEWAVVPDADAAVTLLNGHAGRVRGPVVGPGDSNGAQATDRATTTADVVR